MSEDEGNVGILLGQIAEKRRTDVVTEISNKTQPSFIQRIEQSEIIYTIDPSWLPYELVDLDQFVSTLHELYGLKHKQKDGSEPTNPLEALLQRQERADYLEFDGGQFRISNREIIRIRAVRLTSESLHIILLGDGSIAEVIAADVIEALWQCAGTSKPWSEIKGAVQKISYGTATKVNLGIPLEEFLNPELVRFFDEQCLSGEKYALHMAPAFSIHNFQPSERLSSAYVVDDLNLLFNLQDPVSGESYRAKFQFQVTAKGEYGSGLCRVVSEMPYETHVNALQKLIEYMRRDG